MIDITSGVDLSIRIRPNGTQVNAFGLPPLTDSPFKAGDFIGDTTRGGSVNCRVLTTAPHGNGTHTETVSHIVDEMYPVCDAVPLQPFSVAVVTVDTVRLGTSGETYNEGEDADIVIPSFPVPTGIRGLIVRTKPNSEKKKSATHRNPPYFTVNAMKSIADSQIEHLLVDTPSVDREEDSGTLRNHRRFWGVDIGSKAVTKETLVHRTITEMIFVPDSVQDGTYSCWVSVPPIETDAMLSHVVLFRQN